MVELLLSDVFRALAHPARRDMVTRLSRAEQSVLSVSQLAAPLEMSLAASSKHVGVLERAGLIRRTVVGREHHCRLQAAPLTEARAWVEATERYWSEHLDALARTLETGTTEAENDR